MRIGLREFEKDKLTKTEIEREGEMGRVKIENRKREKREIQKVRERKIKGERKGNRKWKRRY
jgi:hypothetical protein